MYAIFLNIDIDNLNKQYNGNNTPNVYGHIRKFMVSNGFEWKSINLYLGDDSINVVKCITTIQQLSSKYEWFKPYIKELRLLRISSDMDLSTAL